MNMILAGHSTMVPGRHRERRERFSTRWEEGEEACADALRAVNPIDLVELPYWA